MADKIDYGMVNSVALKAGAGPDDFFTLVVRPASGDPFMLKTSREALRKLWSYLAKALFPAGSQITKRVGTVLREKDQASPEVTYDMTAYLKEGAAGIVSISGFSRAAYWTLLVGKAEAENLWSELEDHLDQI
jgi:hypothetical protein